MAKTQNIRGQKVDEEIEEPWMVVGAPGSPMEGKPVYLLSESGITRERAEELAGRLQHAVAAPVSETSE